MTNLAEQLSASLASVVETSSPSVVRVEGHRRLWSSGVVWSADGIVIAAHHALEVDEGVDVGLPDGKVLKADVVGRDPGTDLAVLRLEASGLVPPRWAPVDEARVGHLVLALSRPGRGARASLGIVSALGEAWRTPAGGRVERFLQSSIVPERGFSGGLLVDVAGGALGVNSAGLLRGNGVALPQVTVKRVVEALLLHGRVQRGYLGISAYPARLTAALATELSQTGGLIVVGVQPESPADKAGILQGDLLVSLDRQALATIGDLQALLDEERIGRELHARVVRAGRPLELGISVGTRP
jgi:S1-C subfamily serine protease